MPQTGNSALSPDGAWVLVSDQIVNEIRVVDAATGSVVRSISAAPSRDIEFSPDGSLIYVTHFRTANLSVIDFASGAFIANVPVGGSPNEADLNADGSLLFVANITTRNVSIVDTAAAAVIQTVPVGIFPVAVQVLETPDANVPPVADAGQDVTAVCTGLDGAVVFLDASTSYDPDGQPLQFSWNVK